MHTKFNIFTKRFENAFKLKILLIFNIYFLYTFGLYGQIALIEIVKRLQRNY